MIYFRYNFIHHPMTFHSLIEVNQAVICFVSQQMKKSAELRIESLLLVIETLSGLYRPRFIVETILYAGRSIKSISLLQWDQCWCRTIEFLFFFRLQGMQYDWVLEFPIYMLGIISRYKATDLKPWSIYLYLINLYPFWCQPMICLYQITFFFIQSVNAIKTCVTLKMTFSLFVCNSETIKPCSI